MARYKHYDYDQMMMVPVSLEEQLVPDPKGRIRRTAVVRDPYARWCGRRDAVRHPPIPIRLHTNK